MYRVSLSALALAFFLAVLTSALPAANNKRQGGMENVMDESFHMANDFMTDPAFTTGGGIGQSTLITPSSSGSSTPATPTPSAASSSTPVRSAAASPTPASSQAHGAAALAASTSSPQPSVYSSAPSTSSTPSSEKEKTSALDILKPITQLLGLGR